MHFINLNNFKLILATAAFSVLAMAAGACAPPPGSPTTSGPPNNTNAGSNTQATPAATTTPAPRVALTLPLLDAMLQDEEFTSELKSSLPLTDEELDRLRAGCESDEDRDADIAPGLPASAAGGQEEGLARPFDADRKA